MKAGYFQCFAGASGDMIIGAMLDAGLSLKDLKGELAKLGVKGYRLSASPAQRGGIAGTKFNVSHPTSPEKIRPLKEVLKLIASSTLSPGVKGKAAAVFQRLGQAEARVHRTKSVTLHIIGEVDTLVDVVGTVIGLELMGIEALYSSPLPAGGGVIQSKHGVFPLPAPAVLQLIALANAPLQSSAADSPYEMVTPTGAALLTTLATFQRPSLILQKVGYGAGERNPPELPNVLPLWIGEVATPPEGDLILLETNIDDMNPQLYGYLMEGLFQKGARDVWLTPVQMKKNRPGVVLSVLAPSPLEGAMVETILRETTTLGIRRQGVSRYEAEREVVEFFSSLGMVRVKIKLLQGKKVSLSPEFEDCRRIAQEQNLPLQEVFRRVTAEATEKLLVD